MAMRHTPYVPLGVVLGLALLASSPARASSIKCWGKMRLPDCSEAGSWAADSQPTVGAACEACWLTPDGGACEPIGPSLQGFQVQLAGRRLDGTFTMDGRRCGDEHLVRYEGPLEPGALHEVVFPGFVDHSQPRPFRLSFEVLAKPAFPRDAGADAAPADAGRTDDPLPGPDAASAEKPGNGTTGNSGSCTYGARGTAGLAPLPFLLGLLAVLGRRRGLPRSSGPRGRLCSVKRG